MPSAPATSLFTGSLVLAEEAEVLADYVAGQRLGEGAYGSVYEVKYVPSGEMFAMKVLPKGGLPRDLAVGGAVEGAAAPYASAAERLIVQEATVMQSLEHPHVTKLYKFLDSTVAFYFIMELGGGGELFDLIISKRYFTEDEARLYFQQLLSAIDYCHRNAVAHMDLKAENLLLTSDHRLIVCDFGFSSKMIKENIDDPESALSTGDSASMVGGLGVDHPFGTLSYMSPEAVLASTHKSFMDGALPPPISRQETSASPGGGTEAGGTDFSLHSSPMGRPARETRRPAADSFRDGTGLSRGERPRRASSSHQGRRTYASPGTAGRERAAGTWYTGLKTSMSASELDRLLHEPAVKGGREGRRTTLRGLVEGGLHALVRSFIGSGASSAKSGGTHGAKGSNGLGGAPSESSARPESLPGASEASPRAGRGGKGRGVSTEGAPPPRPPASTRHRHVLVDPFQQDLWSAGVILFFMLTGRLPFDGRDDEETLHLIQNNCFAFTEAEASRLSAAVRRLITQMLAPEPSDRPTLEQIMESAWFLQDIRVADDFPHREDLLERWARAPAAAPPRPDTFLDFSQHPHAVTPAEEAALEKAFHKIDSDGYSLLTRDQLRDMLTTLRGEEVPQMTISELVRLFTGSPTSTFVTFEQFRDAWVNKNLARTPFAHHEEFQLANIIGVPMEGVEQHVVRTLRRAFDNLDESHSGVVHLHQLRRLFERCHIDVMEDGLISLMRLFHHCSPAPCRPSRSGAGKGAASSPSSPSAPGSPSDLGESLSFSFDAFVAGVIQREILLRHPLGRKLAAATNLAALFQSLNVTQCVHHGLVVVGAQSVILDKLSGTPDRLRLLYSDEALSITENIYSFRFVGSAVLSKGAALSTAAPRYRPPLLKRGDPGRTTRGMPTQPRLSTTTPAPPGLSERAGGRETPAAAASDAASTRRRAGARGAAAGGPSPCGSPTRHRHPRDGRPAASPLSGGLHEALVSGAGEGPLRRGCGSPHGHFLGRPAVVGMDGATTPLTGSTAEVSTSASSPTAASVAGLEGDSLGTAGRAGESAPRGPRRPGEGLTDPVLPSLAATPKGGSKAPKRPPTATIAQPRTTAAPAPTTTTTTITTTTTNATTSVAPTASAAWVAGGNEKATAGGLPSRRPPEGSSVASSPKFPATRSVSGPLVEESLASATVKDSASSSRIEGAVASPLRSSSFFVGAHEWASGGHEAATSPLQFPKVLPENGMPAPATAARSPGPGPCVLGASFSHRTLTFGGLGAATPVSGVCDVDVLLAPAFPGYTLVRFRRIYGQTQDFHEAVAFISALLDVERQQAVEDTMARGESELM